MNAARKLGVAAAIGTFVFATGATAVQLWTSFAPITDIYTGKPDKSITIFGPSNPQACPNMGIRFAVADADTEAIRDLAVASMLSGKKVRCLTDGCVLVDGQTMQRGLNCQLTP
jgi:hypothetical protein